MPVRGDPFGSAPDPAERVGAGASLRRPARPHPCWTLTVDLDLPRGQGPMPSAPTAVAEAAPTDGGFRDEVRTGVVPAPTDCPWACAPHRSGTTTTPDGPTGAHPHLGDGRAWLSVSATDEWPRWPPVRRAGGGSAPRPRPRRHRLPGEDGERVRPPPTAAPRRSRRSVGRTELPPRRRASAGPGDQVPGDWAESTTADLATARQAVRPTYSRSTSTASRGAPPCGSTGGTVVASFTGAGDRRFVLEQSGGEAAAARRRRRRRAGRGPGRARRFVLERGELEWFEQGHVLRLRSSLTSARRARGDRRPVGAGVTRAVRLCARRGGRPGGGRPRRPSPFRPSSRTRPPWGPPPAGPGDRRCRLEPDDRPAPPLAPVPAPVAARPARFCPGPPAACLARSPPPSTPWARWQPPRSWPATSSRSPRSLGPDGRRASQPPGMVVGPTPWP